MDFARKQLEKYGWTDGKGLGKHENGISQALKPKLKRSVAGVGHDMASDFTEHWWSALYDKAAGNVQVQEKHGKTKKIKTKDNQFEITNSTWHIRKKKKGSEKEEYGDYFVKTAILANGGSNTENLKESESEDEEEIEKQKKYALKMTDEELFAACEGRTAHKGARHGLKALGKLARIERQEQLLLAQPKYNGYSHAKKLKKEKLSINDLHIVEDMNLNSDEDTTCTKKKKKKIKNRLSNEDVVNTNTRDIIYEAAEFEAPLPETSELENPDGIVINLKNEEIKKKKTKKSKRKNDADYEETQYDDLSKPEKKKNKLTDIEPVDMEQTQETLEKVKKSKKKKKLI